MSIASLVLSLVGIIPCFWAIQIPGLLGLIFGLVGRRQIKASNGTQKGGKLAMAGVIIGIVLLAICAIVWIAVAADEDHCFSFGSTTC